jgi:nitrite reductase (NADH) small subunit
MMSYIIGHISEFRERAGRVLKAGDTEIALFKLSDGRIKAVENRCPHKNGKLSEGIVCDHHVYCPLHDWKIDLQDGVVQAPDEGCVKTYKVEVNAGGHVILYLDGVQSLVS